MATHDEKKGTKQMRIHIRTAIHRDIPMMLQIEQLSFKYAWIEEDFLYCWNKRNYIQMVAEHGEKVVGFMFCELHKNKLHIVNFAVHPNWLHRKIGTQMVAKCISLLRSHHQTKITVEVRETNLPAQLFLHRQEFRATRVLRAFYKDSGEDAYLMEYPPPDDFEKDMAIQINRIAKYD